MSDRARVLIVDDSALIRQLLSAILGSDPQIEVVGMAPDPIVARQMIKDLDPQVLTLDVEMPGMDGLAFLEKVMTLRPMPVVMVSTLTQQGAETTVRALELGAVDFVAKPNLDPKTGLGKAREELIAKVKAAAKARVRPYRREGASAAPARPMPRLGASTTIIAIGASTGGVGALQNVITRLPAGTPGILVTQHMPPGYTARFAARLDGLCAMKVMEASDRKPVQPGCVYIAPGGRHLELVRTGDGFACRLHDGDLVSGHRPSVDVLFHSVAEQAGPRAVGVILTGMGNDGAAGLLAMRGRGAHTIGESEATCVVYGMPRAAAEAGAVGEELPIQKVADAILGACAAASHGHPPSRPPRSANPSLAAT